MQPSVHGRKQQAVSNMAATVADVVAEEAPAEAPAVKKAPTTPYFAFCEEHRGATKAALLADKEPGTKVSVADVAKELGRRWKLLSAEEKAAYKERVAAAAATANSSREHAADDDGTAEHAKADGHAAAGTTGKATKQAATGLPLSLVKRIICLDEDVERVSHDALLLITQATEHFLELVAARCAANMMAAKPKRSTVRLVDFAEAVKRDRRLVAAGLRDVLNMAQTVAAETAAAAKEAKAAAAAEQGENAENAKQGEHEGDAAEGVVQGEGDGQQGADNGKGSHKAGRKRKAADAPAATRAITSYFKAAD